MPYRFHASITTCASSAVNGTTVIAAVWMSAERSRVVRAWQSSLPVLMADLKDAGLQQVEVLVEHRLQLSSKRTDVIVAGAHPRTGEPSYLVVELKQWSHAHAHPDDVESVHVAAYGSRPVLHPGGQVHNYVNYMRDFMRDLDGRPEAVSGAAYLHNASRDAVASLLLRPQTTSSRLFIADDWGRWLQYLQRQFAPEPGAAAADLLLSSAVAPSKQLMRLAAEEIQQREQFVLLDEQDVACRLVLNAVDKAVRGDHKSVVLVTGGPGSGKSVIALSARGVVPARACRRARDPFQRFHTDTAQGRGVSQPSGPAAVRLLQPVRH